jgi:AcrR family transcriptional regulator
MTGMDTEQLRQAVMRATLPLIAEYETLTTAKIAQAAGIDEADLLAVFADKDAVMQASIATMAEVVTAATDPAEEMRERAADPYGSAARVAPRQGDRHPRRLLPPRPYRSRRHSAGRVPGRWNG